MKKKVLYRILLPILILMAVIIAIEGTAQTPFGGIKRSIWDWKHKDVEKTWSYVNSDTMLGEPDDLIVEYKGDIYCGEYNDETDEHQLYH